MENLLEKIYNDKNFIHIIEDLIKNETIQKMKNYKQHYETSCFDHCLTASYYCYKICKKLKLDYISCSRAALLHDLFLYDWRKRENGRKGFHAFTHPKTAYENASKLFNLNDKEADIILKHMWPVTFFSFPKYIESLRKFITDFVRKKFSDMLIYFYVYYLLEFKRNCKLIAISFFIFNTFLLKFDKKLQKK